MIRIHKNSNIKIKQIIYIDLSITLGYFIYFLGFLLVLFKLIDCFYLPLFSLPHFLTALFLAFYSPEDNLYVSSKRMLICESI